MIPLGIILFIIVIILFCLDRKISNVHLTKLQNVAQTPQNRALKNLAFRRSQSLFLLRTLLFIIGFSGLYIAMTHLDYLYALVLVVAVVLILKILEKKMKILDPVLTRLMLPIDQFVRRYDHQLNKLSKYFIGAESDLRIYRPYDDKEFKKLIISLSSSDNLVNKKVLGKIENLFRLEYKTVEDIMIPMSKVIVIDEDDYVGPILLDELHKTTRVIFPVAAEGQIIGSVHLSDMKDHTGKTKIKDLAKSKINYVQEDATVQDLIEVISEYKNEQFLVLDGKENIQGVVDIYQVIQLLFDQKTDK
ncbi:hypothetical protein A3F37_00915 [Candidatus Saccharibacteria bacterium RIFCSPHIGHO2_12_FULL_41_12]|nr:MAG: hypothetical protein A3F37_00915 [Candidatus Saccharibacteria bacterium RIFCSPHIGHO2_12_FULL_41_12]